jgi:hypothetical protein
MTSGSVALFIFAPFSVKTTFPVFEPPWPETVLEEFCGEIFKESPKLMTPEFVLIFTELTRDGIE